MDFCMSLFLTQRPSDVPPALQELKETEELDIQLKVFNENKEEDSIELSHRLEDIRAEMEYPFTTICSLWTHIKTSLIYW